jgi:hypothetical protein
MQPVLPNSYSDKPFDVYLYITTANNFTLKNSNNNSVSYKLYLNRENEPLTQITSSHKTFLISGITTFNYLHNIMYLSTKCTINTQIDAGEYKDTDYLNFITSD